jgi:B12-binding domain/radical SAM domain protein
MRKKIAFVAYYQKENIYSFNALIAAIETEAKLDDIDLYFIRGHDNLYKDLEAIVDSHITTVVGVSFFTTQIWEISELIKSLREKYKNDIFVIAGGPHPTGDPEGTLKMGFDLVVRGEGEETLIKLLKKIKINIPFNDTKGIGYLGKENNLILTKKRQRIDLDKYPPLPIKNVKYGAIEITRGCPYVCYFCQTPYILGSVPRHRSIKSICDAVRIMKGYEKTDIRFISPNAFSYGSHDGKLLNLPVLENLLINIKKIIGTDGRIYFGTFPSEVRPEHVTEETLRLVSTYAANDNIVIGAQSGSQRILNSCNRGHSVEDIYEAVALTIKKGLLANVDFIFNLPNETEDDINLTIDVLNELSKMGAKIHTHTFMPLPLTVFANEDVKEISENTRRIISKLSSKGLAYGDWQKQEKLAIDIARYFKNKKLHN